MPDDIVREERRIGACTVLFGAEGGKYPEGNSLLLKGAEETMLIDPSLGVAARTGFSERVDHVLLSHCHEDHLAGAYRFPEARAHVHEADLPGWQSMEGFLGIYGYQGAELRGVMEEIFTERFNYRSRPDAQGYRDGAVFELGGGVRVTVIHTPGHTRGHSALYLSPDDILFLGDIDLSSFGPYYGDAWSDLEDFERSIARVREIEARHYATFHHIGVVDRAHFLTRLARFEGVIAQREQRLLAFLSEAPRSLDQIAAHRFVYRPGDDLPYADAVERRSMGLHLARLLRDGRVQEPEPGKFHAGVV